MSSPHGMMSTAGPLTKTQETDLVEKLAMRIKGTTSLDNIMVMSNAKNVDDVVRIINEGKEDPASDTVLGTVVSPGCITMVTKNDIVTAVGPGRHRLWSHRASFGETYSVVGDMRCIRDGPVTVLRVPNGHYGLALRGNVPVIISSENGGLYAVNDGMFRFVEFVVIDQRHIQHDTIHIVRVPQGQYACVTESDVPAFLPHGIYVMDSTTFQVHNFANLSQESVRHKTITRFYVRSGSVGLAWKDSVPVFYDDPGVYLVDSAMFHFVRAVDVSEQEITLGSRKIITVREGEVGISHDNGQLTVLPPGRHFIEKPGHLFNEFLSTQQECLSLQKESTTDLMVCETSELVSIGVQASVFYNIQDPRLAVIKIGERINIERFINETATAVISTIIRSTSLAEISQGQKKEPIVVTGGDKDKMDRQDSFEPNMPFFDRVKGDFIERLQSNFLNEYGICMLNVRIGDFKVLEKNISQSIANHALITAETQANLANLEGRRQIDLVNKDSDARIEKIQADVDAHKVMTRSRAEANVVRETAAAHAEATTIEARARAEAIELVAAAEAAATKLRGEAEAKRAQMIGEVAFGREVTLAEIQAKMMTESIGGVEKMVYLPTDMQQSPFGLFNMNALSAGGMPMAKQK